jgi:phosphate/sulfate permease
MLMAVAVSLMVNKIFRNKFFFPEIDEKMRIGIVFFLAAILGFSQYVATHYDNSAVLLFLVTAYWSFKYYFSPSVKNLLWICVFTMISAFNRETVCLNISLLGALMLNKFSTNWKDYKPVFSAVIFPAICFVLAYLVLRIVKPQVENQDFYFFESITLKYNFTGINQIAGWLFGVLTLNFIYYYATSAENRKLISRFLIFSSPYILMIFLVGILWEIRLFVPLIFGATVLAFFNFNKLNLHIDSTD